jgi:hypothetical protein
VHDEEEEDERGHRLGEEASFSTAHSAAKSAICSRFRCVGVIITVFTAAAIKPDGGKMPTSI